MLKKKRVSCKPLSKNQSISREKIFWWTGGKAQVPIDAVDKSRWFTAKRLCIHQTLGLPLWHTTETHTPIFQLHQQPPMYYIITCIILDTQKSCRLACLCFLPTVLTGSSESHIFLSLIYLMINDTCCQHLRLRMQTDYGLFSPAHDAKCYLWN